MSFNYKGKQIEDSSIEKIKLNLVTPTLSKDPVTKGYFDARTVNGKPLSDNITITKSDLGLSLVDNVPDSDKPVSTAQAAAINEKMAYGTISYFRSTFDTALDVIYISDVHKAGLFVYDPTSSNADDGGITLVKNTKRYVRQYTGFIDPRWYGAVPDGVTNNNTAFVATNTAALLHKKGIYITGGSYLISTDITLSVNTSGDGTILTTSSAKVSAGANNLVFRDFTVNGNNFSGGGFYASGRSGLFVTGMKVTNTSGPNMWFASCHNIRVLANFNKGARGNFADGIYFGGCYNINASFNDCSDFQRIGITGDAYISTECLNATVLGNRCYDAFESTNHVTYTNGGIWFENTRGAIISNNYTANTYDRGIVLTPAVDSAISYSYIMNNNDVHNADRGMAFVFAQGQRLTAEGCHITDCRIGFELGDFEEATLNNISFFKKNKLVSEINELVRYVPTTVSGKKSNITISECKNFIGAGMITPMFIDDSFGHNGDVTIRNCTGNWAYTLGSRTLNGTLKVENTLLDFSLRSVGTYVTNNIKSKFTDCEIKLPTGLSMNLLGPVEFKDSYVHADSLTRMVVGAFGSATIIVDSCKFDYTTFYDVRKVDTVIKFLNSEFDNYSATGIIQLNAAQIASIEIRGNRFSKTNLNIPIQLPFGTQESIIGNNVYYSPGLFSGFIASTTAVNFSRGTTALRPTVTQIGFQYYDTTINKLIYWNGTEWVVSTTPPTYSTNAATTAPNKAGLNALYAAYKAGSVVYYGSVSSGGGRDYTKLTDSATSDWLQTLWSDGVKTIIA